jgi:hypothetical protein
MNLIIGREKLLKKTHKYRQIADVCVRECYENGNDLGTYYSHIATSGTYAGAAERAN